MHFRIALYRFFHINGIGQPGVGVLDIVARFSLSTPPASCTAVDAMAPSSFNPTNVNLDTANLRDVYCYIQATKNDYNGQLGARISALFVILVISTAVTFFPVLATRVRRLKIPRKSAVVDVHAKEVDADGTVYVYLFARYFGAGVIVATAFIQYGPPTPFPPRGDKIKPSAPITSTDSPCSLLDPAYAEIGPDTCVGQTKGWAEYSWPPAIALTSCIATFLLDFAAERYVEKKYGYAHGTSETQDASAMRHGSVDTAMIRYPVSKDDTLSPRECLQSHQFMHSADQDQTGPAKASTKGSEAGADLEALSVGTGKEHALEQSFRQQIAAFLILEFGVIFHSVIIGLTLGTAGSEFADLYPVRAAWQGPPHALQTLTSGRSLSSTSPSKASESALVCQPSHSPRACAGCLGRCAPPTASPPRLPSPPGWACAPHITAAASPPTSCLACWIPPQRESCCTPAWSSCWQGISCSIPTEPGTTGS